ncbi:MAG: hypothetical protein Q8L21_01850 [Candidatus Komeilibacteria bacterium]|nr:hypothetical protein [Candidatus Komeilibacteria bacterium]
MENNNQKQMTLDDLAVITANGFSELGGRMDKLDGRMGNIEGRMEGIEGRMEKVENNMIGLGNRMDKLESSVSGLRSSVNHYLDLSNECYLELKHRDTLIVNWLKVIGDKTGVPIDVGQLEKVI